MIFRQEKDTCGIWETIYRKVQTFDLGAGTCSRLGVEAVPALVMYDVSAGGVMRKTRRCKPRLKPVKSSASRCQIDLRCQKSTTECLRRTSPLSDDADAGTYFRER